MLQGKTFIVTGANGTVGRAVSAVARAQGAIVHEWDLVFDGEAEQRHIVDLTDAAAVEACCQAVGDFDGVFNVAGGFAMGADAWTDDEDWDFLFKINVTTLRTVLGSAVPKLIARSGGAIVNVGAYGALQGQAAMSAYCASKSSVMRITESLSAEVREKGINVNAVLPTVIDTPANRAGMPDADPAQWVAPEDLANVICFLGSDSARAVHGALLPVRGLS